MKHIIFLISLFVVQTLYSQNAIPKKWIGTVTINDSIFYTKLYIQNDSGRISIPQRKIVLTDFKSIKLGSITGFEAGSGAISFNGNWNHDSLSGIISVNGQKGRMILKAYIPVTASDIVEFGGTYKLRNGEIILSHAFSDGIEITNYSTGEIIKYWQSTLHPGEFFQVLPLGNGFKKRLTEYSLMSIKNGKIAIKKSKYSGGILSHTTALKETLYSEQDFTFTNDSVKIAGRLKTPLNTNGKNPLLVIVPGSGESTKDSYYQVTNYFATKGIAVFLYDKRGYGESTGNSDTADLSVLASDVVVMINDLCAEKNIDTSKIILWGHSQGGWIAPIVANNCKKVAAIISVSGPTDEPGVQTTFWVENFLRTSNFSATDIKDAVEWMNLITKVMDAHGEGYEAVAARLPEIEKKSWQNWVTIPTSKENLLSWGGYYFYPIPELMKLKIPIFSIYGEIDININSKANSKKMKEIINIKKDKYSKVLVFPKSDHDIILCQTGNRDLDLFYQGKYANGYFSAMKEWIEKLVRSSVYKN